MYLQAIESFLTVYKTQNLTRASEALFVTQQCLSRHIKALEEELGVQLFLRKKAGMVPTEVCDSLYPEFRKMMACYGNALQICDKQKKGDTGKLSVALANGLSSVFDVSSLSVLVRAYTGCELFIDELANEKCGQMLINREVDMAFLLEPFDSTMLEHEVIFKDYGCIAIHKGHPLAQEKGTLSFSALDGIKIVTGPSTNASIEHFWRYCARSNVHPETVASVTNITGFINRLTRDDIAVSLLRRLVPQITNPDIVIRTVTSPVLEGRCHCCFFTGSEKAPLLRDLMSKIKEYFAESTNPV